MSRKWSHGREPDWSPRWVAELSARALVQNFDAISDLVPDHSILPMIKANGYGHGAAWVARMLMGAKNLYGFGVATLEEGAELRRELGPLGRKSRIIVFSGAAHWSEGKGHYCEKFHLTPVIASDEDWKLFVRGGWISRIPYEIKFNTGMNRLGLSPSSVRAVLQALKDKTPDHHPSGVLTHLAMGEHPDSKLSHAQRECFEQIKRELASKIPSAHFHMANSAGVWNAKQWSLRGFTDVVRPGLALYGVTPWKDAPLRGITPVMTLRSQVILRRTLKAGESLGYGAGYTVEAGETSEIAILAAGYADGIHRTLSGRGHVWIGNRANHFLGRVSMDLSAVGCTRDVRVGDWAEIFGPNVDPWAQAKAAETIPYELLTSVSGRVQRVYV